MLLGMAPRHNALQSILNRCCGSDARQVSGGIACAPLHWRIGARRQQPEARRPIVAASNDDATTFPFHR
jgi:hypothetical protein